MLPQNLRYGFRDYQLVTHSNIRGIYSRDEYNRLACSVSPTGSGKSFIGMGEIVQAGMGFDTDTSWLDSGSSIDENGIIHDKKILYIAPTNSILSQVKLHIVKSLLLSPYDFSNMSIADINQMMKEDFSNINFKDITLGGDIDEESLSASDKRGMIIKNLSPRQITDMVKRAFPGLSLKCYAGIKGLNLSDEEKITKEEMESAELIVLDEAHRIMADTWKADVQSLLDNNHTAKILAVTATPDRMDKAQANVMAVLAKMVYPDATLTPDMYMASDMYVLDAIRDGKVNAPEISEPDFSVIRSKQYEELALAWINENNPEEKERLNNILSRIDEEVIGVPNYHKLKKDKAEPIIENQIQDTVAQAVSPTGKYIAFVPANLNKAELTQEQHFIEQARQIREHFAKVTDNNGKAVPITISYVSSEGAGIIDENGVIHPPVRENEDGTKENVPQKDASDVILQQFEGESSTTGGIKIVLSIDKISEGVHVDGIDGVLMCRSIGENSTNVYLQESGRAISSMDPDKPFEAHKKTQVIDLVGNTFKQVVAGKTTKTSRAYDLQKIKELSEWIENNGRFPDINSKAPDSASDKEKAVMEFEARCAITLKSISAKYSVFRDGLRPLKDKEIIDEIMTLAEGIKLFDHTFGEREVVPSEEELTGGDFLSLNPKQQRFMELYNEGMSTKKDKSLSDRDKVIKTINILKILNAYKSKAKGELKLPPGVIIPARIKEKGKVVYKDIATESYGEGYTLRKFLEDNFEPEDIAKIIINLNDPTLLEEGETGKHLTDVSREENFNFGEALAELRGKFWSSQSYFYKTGINLFEGYTVSELIEYGVLDDAIRQYDEIEDISFKLTSNIYKDEGPDEKGFIRRRGFMLLNNFSTADKGFGNFGCDVGLIKEFEETSLITGEKFIDGYDRDGYDREGFDEEGFNRYGFNREGFHRITGEAYDERGFYYDYEQNLWVNLETGTEYDLLGYNIVGLNKDGFERAKPIANNQYFQKSFWHIRMPDGSVDSHKYEYSRETAESVDVNALGFDRKDCYVDSETHKRTKDKFDSRGFNAEGYSSRSQSDYDEKYVKSHFKEPFGRDGYDANGFDKDGFKQVTITGEDGQKKSIFVNRRTSAKYDIQGRVRRDGRLVMHDDITTTNQILSFMNNLGVSYDTIVAEFHRLNGKDVPIEEYTERFSSRIRNAISIMKRAPASMDTFEQTLSDIKDSPEKIEVVRDFLDKFPDLKKFLPVRTANLTRELKVLEELEKSKSARNRNSFGFSSQTQTKEQKRIEEIKQRTEGINKVIDDER